MNLNGLKTLFKAITFLLLLLIASNRVIAQTQLFQKVYGGYSYDFGNDLIQTADTGYILLCTSSSFSGNSDMYLLKVNKKGEFVWQSTIGGEEIEGACTIKPTSDGNLALAGYTNSYGNGFYDFYLVKTDMNGAVLWSNNYGTANWDLANSMDTCLDGGFILAGKTYSPANGYSDILVVKTDANGVQEWQKTYGGNLDDVANTIITVADGYLICGSTKSYGAGGSDMYIIKINTAGDIVWERTLGGAEDDIGNTIIHTSDDKIVCGGAVKSYGFANNFNSYLMKLNMDGTDFWPAPGNYSASTVNFEIIDLIESPSNRLVSVADFDNNGLSSGDFGFFVNTNNGYFVASSTFGGNFSERPSAVINCLDGGFAMIGKTNSFGFGLDNIYFVKTDSIGTPNIPLTVLVGVKDEKPLSEITDLVYPNPFKNSTSIALNYPISFLKSTQIQLRVYDQIGNNVSANFSYQLSEMGKGTLLTLTQNSLSSGLYYYNIVAKDKVISSGKFSIID